MENKSWVNHIDDLKPCPFCRNKNFLRIVKTRDTCKVECTRCCSSGPLVKYGNRGYLCNPEYAETESVKLYNYRGSSCFHSVNFEHNEQEPDEGEQTRLL